jgi:uncharacterized Zn ribbon protein
MCDLKVCFKCEQEKSLTEFYKHKMMADGHLNKCKDCTKKDVKENTIKNHNYYVEYDKQRANLPHRVKARKEYSQTKEGKLCHNNSHKKWTENNLVKRSANIIVNNAVSNRRLIKPDNCENCGSFHDRIHGHHDDYNYPMAVRWLCPKCHNAWHKENGSGING